MAETAEVRWWVFVATFLAVVILVGGLAIAMARSQRRVVALHRHYLRLLVRAHEEERARIAREVHDDAVQRLALISREIEIFGMSTSLTDAGRAHHLNGIHNEVHDLAHALRQLAHRLHPAAIEHAALNVALVQLAGEITRAHEVRVETRLPQSEPELTPEVRLALFRIAQEAVRNVVRHARAHVAIITVTYAEDAVEMIIQDHGLGFDPSTVGFSGMGLIGIEERARLVGGTASIVSAPGEGTRITVRVQRSRGWA